MICREERGGLAVGGPAAPPGAQRRRQGAGVAEALVRAHRAPRAPPPGPPTPRPLVLHDVEGLSTQEIAEALDVKPGTIKSRVHRGRLYLRKRLAELR